VLVDGLLVESVDDSDVGLAAGSDDLAGDPPAP